MFFSFCIFKIRYNWIIDFCQNFIQCNGFRVLVYIILVPVVGLGYLCIQNRHICPDVFTFFFSDLFFDQVRSQFYRIIEHIKIDSVPLPLGFSQYLIFVFALGADANTVLCQTAEHIFALSNIDDLAVNADLIDSCVFELFRPALAYQHLINIFFISVIF